MVKVKDYAKRVIKSDYSIVLSFDLLAKAVIAVTTVMLVRVLTIEDYATYTNFSEVSGIFTSIVGTGLSIPYVTYSAEQNSRNNDFGNTLFNTCCLLLLFITILSNIFLPLIISTYKISIALSVLAIVYGGILSQNKLAQSFFQSKMEFKKSGYAVNLKNFSLLALILLVYLFCNHISSESAAVVTTISGAIAFVACFIWIWIDNKSYSIHTSKDMLFRLIGESKWLILYLIFQSLFGSICIILLNQMGTRADVANFGVANKYYGIFLVFLSSLQTVLRVKTNQKEYVDKASKRREFSINWVKQVFPLALAVVLVAELAAGFALPLLNGDGYGNAVAAFRILLLAVFAGYLFSPNTAILIAAKRHKLLLGLAIISCITGGLSCFFLLPYIGVMAAAISIVISNLILNGTGYCIILIAKD